MKFFLGKPGSDYEIENFSSLSDDSSKYGTIKSGVVLPIRKQAMRSGLRAYIINEGGDVPQDPAYNDGQNPNPDTSAAPGNLNWAYIHPARSRGATKGSEGCPTTRNFSAFDRAVQDRSEGNDKMIIFR